MSAIEIGRGNKKRPPDPDLSKVTRVSIVTELGRYEYWGDRWEIDIQDEGRTLKLRARGEGVQPKADRLRALKLDFATEGHEYTKRMLERHK